MTEVAEVSMIGEREGEGEQKKLLHPPRPVSDPQAANEVVTDVRSKVISSEHGVPL